MADFLYHKLSEKEKKQIKKQAKSIIEDFSEKLSKVKTQPTEDLIERKDMERKENKDSKKDKDFRKIMFENAPEKNNDFIIAEKKQW